VGVFIWSEMRNRVLCYITRARKDILVFEHTEDYPDAGIQVPGGGVEEGEAYEQAALRECFEETGLQLSRAVYLGAKEYFDDMTTQMGHFFWLEAPLDTPDAWKHFAEGKYTYSHYFVPLENAKISWNMDILLPVLREKIYERR
jgi:8-oxo-dGTP diphosphatase